jgi:hypothetical protein
MKTRLQPFSCIGPETSMFRLVYCFFSYREVQIALRSMVTLVHGDHEESQVPDLWLEADYFSPALSVAINPTSDPPVKRKATPSSMASVDAQTLSLSTALEASSRSVFAFLALEHMIASGYRESPDFTPVLSLSSPTTNTPLPPGRFLWALSLLLQVLT